MQRLVRGGIAGAAGTTVLDALSCAALAGAPTRPPARAAIDLPVARLNVSGPTTRSAADRTSGAVPHLACGLVTYVTVVTSERPE
ncbi:hypothetical protein [Streptomyces spinosirectus]